jgi:hypothetical protein
MHNCGMQKLAFSVLVIAMTSVGAAADEVDYAALYGKGLTFAAFVESAGGRADNWRRNSADAAIEEDMIARVRALPAKRRMLVVAEPTCSDSVATLPYLAKLVEESKGKLEIRVVNSTAGRAVMEAHRTPDGRAATPTIVVLGEDDQVAGAWSERPAALQTWYIDQKSVLSRAELMAQKTNWYAKDGGKSAIAEIVAILTK